MTLESNLIVIFFIEWSKMKDFDQQSGKEKKRMNEWESSEKEQKRRNESRPRRVIWQLCPITAGVTRNQAEQLRLVTGLA